MEQSMTGTFTPHLHAGVIVCRCGDQIAGYLDAPALAAQAKNLPGVVYSSCEAYPCSKDGQERFCQAIQDHHLEGVVVAGCVPRLVEKIFQQAAAHAGLPASRIEVVDIREQCARVHTDEPAAAQRKALDLIAMGTARLSGITPMEITGTPITRSVAVIGSGLGGLSAVLPLVERNIPVSLIEYGGQLGGALSLVPGQVRALIAERMAAVCSHPLVSVHVNSQIHDISGKPGSYRIWLESGGEEESIDVGAILLAGDAIPAPLNPGRWVDRERVKTQVEFALELEQASSGQTPLQYENIVMILCGEDARDKRCSRICCQAGIRQALLARRLNPDSRITILFRDLVLSSGFEEQDILQARDAGITFFRYQNNLPPKIGDKVVIVPDRGTGEPLRIPFDRLVLSTPLAAPSGTNRLAALFGLSQDRAGFLVEPRWRLRPERRSEDGIFLIGGLHQPADVSETLFQAYTASARAARFIERGSLVIGSSTALVSATLCTGCGSCVPVCPTNAITLQPRSPVSVPGDMLSLSTIEPLHCIGCGACVVECPVKAISLPGWEDQAILAQISAALQGDGWLEHQPRILVFACEWSAYAAADLAGARGMTYPVGTRILRMNCSARFDPNHILWAFLNGADGVFLGACSLGECHYGQGNLLAQRRFDELQRELAAAGFDPQRLRLAFLAGDDALGFVTALREFTADFSGRVKTMEPVTAAAQMD